MDQGAASYRRFIDGDRDAFGEVIDLYRESLIFFIHRYVNDMDTAEDLAEDVFVELIVHPERFGEKSSLKTYVFAIDGINSSDQGSGTFALSSEPNENVSPQLREHVRFDKTTDTLEKSIGWVLEESGDGYIITDLNSTNGTSVNGHFLETNESMTISPGDQLSFADQRYRFL